MAVDKTIGYRVIATQGTSKVLYEQDFLLENFDDAEDRARKNHKHTRDIFPDAVVVMVPLFEGQSSQATPPVLPDSE